MIFWIGPAGQSPPSVSRWPSYAMDRDRVQVPDDVRLREHRRGLDQDFGKPVIEERLVREDVLDRVVGEDVHAQPRRADAEFLGPLDRGGDHRWLPSSGQRSARFAATASKCSVSAVTTPSVSRASIAARIGACRSADQRRSAPGTTRVR